MPYIKDKNLVNIYEEVDKANQTIYKLNTLLKEEEENNTILKKHRVILGSFSLLLLLLFLWSFVNKSKEPSKKYLEKNHLTLVNTDSLNLLKDAVSVNHINQFEQEDLGEDGIAGEPVIYSIQIGAFSNFKAKLFSDDLAHMKEFTESGLNKYAIGNFITYEEAKVLKDDLRNLGFKDCFIIAQSYGESINIREALELSEETQYLN